MVGFNMFLEAEGLAPALVKLIRHQDKRQKNRPTPYELWLATDGRFDLYQSIQHTEKYKGASHIAAFVATPFNETLLAGVYLVGEVRPTPPGIIDPIWDTEMTGTNLYSLEKTSALEDYCGRLIVDWGPVPRAWVQWAHRNDKTILEIKRQIVDPPFPGFLEFRARLSELGSVPHAWRTALESVRGIYLLVSSKTGERYVGSASGERGFWQRWEDYVVTGHGGNKLMIPLAKQDYLVSILEVASSRASNEDVVHLENQWKEKLQTKRFGLNQN